MPYGLKGYGLGDCINTDANGVGVDSATQEACVKSGVSTVVAVPGSGGAQYGTVVNGQVLPIYNLQNVPQTFSQWMSANGMYVGLGVGAFFLMMMAAKR